MGSSHRADRPDCPDEADASDTSDTSSASRASNALQRRPAPTRPASPPRARDPWGVSAFAHVGQTFFVASDSFEAILDTSSGQVYGGGGQVQLPWYHLFARIDVSRFQKDGERAFVSGGEVFKLGIPATITLTPIEFTGGYRQEIRFGRRGPQPPRGKRPALRERAGVRLIPFAGAGVGVVRYEETSDFAESGDDVSESFTSYHVIGGVEIPIWRWIGVGAEYQHRWVPDGLGTGGVSEAFNETDLGGGTFRFRVIFEF